MTARTAALITPFFDAGIPGGGVLYSLDVVREWLARGRRVHVLTSARSRTLGDLAAAEREGRLTLHSIADAEQVRFTHVPFDDVYARTAAALAAIRPDVVHVHNTHGVLAAVRAALDAASWPCVLTALDFGLLCFNFRLHDGTAVPCSGPQTVDKCRACLLEGGLAGPARWAGLRMPRSLTRRLWPRYARLEHYKSADAVHALLRSILVDLDAIIAPSPIVADQLIRYGAPPERVHEVLYGVEPDKAARPPKIDAPRVRLAFLGGGEAIKGLDVLLQAAALLPDGLALDVLAFGDDDLRARIDAMGPATRRYVRATPARFGADLAAAHAELDAVLVPSLWHENSPFVVLEAFANGTPVIAADQAGIRHLVHHDHNGWLVLPGLVRAWAEALHRAVRERDRLRAFREYAHCDRRTAHFVDDLDEIESALHQAADFARHTRVQRAAAAALPANAVAAASARP